jgi:hypothetical protein
MIVLKPEQGSRRPLTVREIYLMDAAASGAKCLTYIARANAAHPRDAVLFEALIVFFARAAWSQALAAMKWREYR